MRRTPSRDAIARCWPSTHPSARSPGRHASRRDGLPEQTPCIRNPLHGTCASGGGGTARRARVTRHPRREHGMGQSSRMRSTLTSQGAVQPQYRAIGGPEQPRRTGGQTAPRPAGERPPQGPHRALRRLPFALLAWRSHRPAHGHPHRLGHRPCEEFQPFAPSLRGHDAHARDVPPTPPSWGPASPSLGQH